MLFFACVCAIVTLAHAQVGVGSGVQVNTVQGTIQGSNATNGNYFVFYGIHYAGDVSGANRFKAPPPPPTYPGVYHAIDNSVTCAQPTTRGLVGVEDCLRLNVFTNNVTVANKPVVVWLTADEYANSDDTTLRAPRSFRRLAEEGIVVVQLNFRLSIFGFLCLGTPEAPGNAGLKDVIQGLKWTQQNIAAFGGDPNNVVLFGHGSGAAMVDLITMSPLATGLVHKAVVQSGSALSPWAVSYDPINSAIAVGSKVGFTGRDVPALGRLLLTTDANILVNAINDFEPLNSSLLFAPCIEDVNLNPNDTFLADAPINLLRNGSFNQIPYIAGYTNLEGTIRAEEAAFRQWLEKMQANFTQFLPVDLDFGVNRTAVERNIREYYFEQRAINMDNIEGFLGYFGDLLILTSVIRGARERAVTSTATVRLYEFAYEGTLNSDWTIPTILIDGARHGVVPNYLLGEDLRTQDLVVSTSLVNRFIGFFRNGVPIQSVSPGPEWLPVTSSVTNYLLYAGGGPVINFTLHSEEQRFNPHYQRMTLWDDIYFKYYTPPRSVSSAGKLFSITLIVLFCQLFVSLL